MCDQCYVEKMLTEMGVLVRHINYFTLYLAGFVASTHDVGY